MNATNMPKQDSTRLRIKLALNVLLENVDHLRSEIHKTFTGGILPRIQKPHAGHPGLGRMVTSPVIGSRSRLMTRVESEAHG
ncbi:TPA: hypothetical protein ACKRYU_005187, partial [Pseudomonas aeruginosa]